MMSLLTLVFGSWLVPPFSEGRWFSVLIVFPGFLVLVVFSFLEVFFSFLFYSFLIVLK